MANTNFTSEQQAAIDKYNQQQQKLTEAGLRNTANQAAARTILKNAGVGTNAEGFFSINSTPTNTVGTTTKPTQQVSQNGNNETIQPTVSNQNNVNNQNNTVQQQGALKPLSQDYYNQSNTESQNTIVSNLNAYRQSNPEYFTDYDSFKKNFSYDARNDTQKQTLDTWYNGYQRGMELNSKTVSDLATQYKNGLISDSDLEQLRTANQGKYGEVMNYINKQTILSKYDEENTPSASDNPFQGIIDQYYNNLLTASQTNASSEMFENYKSQMNSPEMTEMSDQLADLDGQIKEYQNELNRIKSDVERRYEGTGASKSKINAIIADESYKIQEAMNTASLQYNTLATKYNNRMTQYQNEFQLQLQEYQFNMQQRNQQMQELGFVMDLMNFETNEQKDEREWNNYVRQYDYQYGNINSKDYASRRKAVDNAVQDVLSEFEGITMIRSKDQMVEDIMNLVDGGMSLGEAITKNIREPIMQKPEYATRQAAKYGGTQSSYNTFTVGGNTYTVGSDGKVSYTASVNSYEGSGMKGAGLRNNNPGNIKDTGFGNVLGTDSKGFAIFASPEDGFDALVQKIENIQNGGSKTYSANDTLYSFFSKYAPDSDGNNSKAYAESVAKQLGVTANTQVKNLDATKFVAAIAKHDSGYDYSTYGQFRGQSSIGGSNDDTITMLAKEYIDGTRTYSDIKATYGEDILNQVGNRAIQLQQNGYEKSTKITDPTKQQSVEASLSKQFDSGNKSNNETIERVEKMEEAFNAISQDKKNDKKTLNAASQAIVIAYNKILDPNSVVREGEFARTAEGQSMLDKISGKMQQISSGGAGLTYDNLKAVVDLSKQFAQKAQQKQNELAQRIANQVDKYGLTIENVLPLSVIDALSTTPSTQIDTNTTTTNTTKKVLTFNLGGTGNVVNPGYTINGISLSSIIKKSK